ncbi:MAG: sodium:proton symporter [Bdellovibrionales bacterium GWA2_49_15]|nr:MAG: sodium:proton symporter [Bdellovibrionales bacterium GWA2_49_15]HAZ12357.1 dicarboxylate/amino acid:cation symporter [Bdellovibrionales bacterium]
MKRHHWLILALVLGALAGVLCHPFADSPVAQFILQNIFEPTGQVFLRLIFMIVVPMVFCGLCLGVYQLSEHHGLGQVVSRTLLYTVLASSASVFIGVSLTNILKPGAGITIPRELVVNGEKVEKIASNAESAKPIAQALVEIIPSNPLSSAVKALDGEMLALMFFALIFGIALARIEREGEKTLSLITILEQIYATCMKIVDYAMVLAPFAVFALVFSSAFKFGHQILISLSYYVAVVLGALLLQQFVVYSALLKSKGISPWKFFSQCREVYLYAFATASSNATLPRSLECAEHKLQLTPESSRFVLTVGSTANQNGTALFEGITVLFLAQIYHVDLTLGQQVQVVLMSILAGIGTAGVPGGSLPLIMILLRQVGIPPEGIGIILGVDRFLDMCRTTINVSGDLVIAALVDHKKPAL